MAVGFWFNAGNNSSAEVHVAESGMINIVEGNPDIGGSRASMALMAAETLQVPYERIRVSVGDTDSTGFSNTTGGSRTTFATGMAVINACEDVIVQLKERAAITWGVDADQVEWVDGEARPAPGVNVDAPPLPLAKIAPRFPKTGGPISARASLERTGPRPVVRRQSLRRRGRPRDRAAPRCSRSRRSRMPVVPSTPTTSRGRCRAARHRASAGR